MNPSFNLRRAFTAGFFALASLALPAVADTIFQDFFTTAGTNQGNPYTSSIVGTAPTVGSGTWLGGVEQVAPGQTGDGRATPTSSNFLAFTPNASLTYTVQATIDTTGAAGLGNSWFTLGFTSSQHNWDGSDSATIDVANLVRFDDAKSSTITYTLSGATLVANGIGFVGWLTDAAGAVNLTPSNEQVKITNFSLTSNFSLPSGYLWDNGAATNAWNTIDANWSGAVWTNSVSNNAFFYAVGGVVNLATITAGGVNVGNTGSNFANVTFSGGSLAAASLTVQGMGSNDGNYAVNPTLSLASGVTVTGDTAVGRANLNVTGGTLTTARIISSPLSADWGRLVVSGGTVIATNGVDGSVNTGATFAIDLNGGELRTPSIRVADRVLGLNNDAQLTFNGGTVKATGADNANFITTYGGGQNTYVASGGAIIDTNGLNIGILVNLLDAGGAGGLTKDGAGTLTLGGTHTYAGNTIVNTGTLVLADNSQLRFVLTEAPDSNRVTGTGTATFNGDFNIDTTAVTGSTSHIWTLVDRTTLTGESFDDTTFTVIGFTDANNDGVWIMTDAKGDWSFSEVTGELTLVAGNDYVGWKSDNGVIGGENDDDDNDGLTNHEEYAFGLDPTGGSSVNPITVPLTKSTGTFSYTRRNPSLPNPALTYSVWYSTNLTTWTEDTGAVEGITTISGEVQTVPVTISPALLTNPKLFIQVRAD